MTKKYTSFTISIQLFRISWKGRSTTVRTPYLKDGHLDLTDGHLDLKDGHLHLTDGHHTWRMDTILDGWTPYLTDGHHTWRMDTILDGWTPYLTDGHSIWQMNILFSWIVYMFNILSFKRNTSFQWSL